MFDVRWFDERCMGCSSAGQTAVQERKPQAVNLVWQVARRKFYRPIHLHVQNFVDVFNVH